MHEPASPPFSVAGLSKSQYGMKMNFLSTSIICRSNLDLQIFCHYLFASWKGGFFNAPERKLSSYQGILNKREMWLLQLGFGDLWWHPLITSYEQENPM